MKLTKWFHRNVKPVRKGVYETYDFLLKKTYYNYFDGYDWHYGSRYIDNAMNCFPSPHDLDHEFKWRGLTRKAM